MSGSSFNPALSPLQRRTAMAAYPPVPANCVVTGGTGIVGARLVEMLVERGAKRVVSFDVVPRERVPTSWTHPNIEYVTGDITNKDDVERAVKGADCVWHLAAAVGPFHPHHVYERVNYQGTVNLIEAMKKHGVRKLVFSSSPSTRFAGSIFSRPDLDGLTEDEMPKLPLKSYMQEYAGTKAMGEMAVTAAVGDDFWAVSVAPHQVYGPRDNLFMPNTLEAAGTGKLRIFGNGLNRICFTHVDNYAHALAISERKLYKGSPVLGQFYIVTDGKTHPEADEYCVFWKEMDKAVVGMGFTSLYKKVHLPFWFLYIIALGANALGFLLGVTFKLNVFNVFVLTMNRWFKTDKAARDLDYTPIIHFNEGWADAIEYFRVHWLPTFEASNKSLFGLAARSQAKIDIQATSVSQNAKK